MKENNKNFKLIRELSDLMKEKNIKSLKYEVSDIKLKIQHDFETNFKQDLNITKEVTKKTLQQEEQIKETEPLNQFSSNHPGAIKSPMVGTAYTSPEPGKDPFIKLGDSVSQGQPLVIIEAMKVMNTINSEKSGKIKYIGFEDGQPVEFDQLLVIIE